MRSKVCVLLLALSTVPAWADTATKFIYSGTLPSTTIADNVEADFLVLANGNLQVTLSNSVADMTLDKQILTGVLFSFADAGATTGTVINPTVPTYNINDSTGIATATGSSVSANWHTEIDLTGYVTLTNLNLNPSGSMGILSSSMNLSGTNNLTKHDPYIEGPVTFEISGLGLTSSSRITGVEFNFGTAIGTYSPTVTSLSATPEPGTLAVSSLAFFAIAGLLGWNKRRCAAAPETGLNG